LAGIINGNGIIHVITAVIECWLLIGYSMVGHVWQLCEQRQPSHQLFACYHHGLKVRLAVVGIGCVAAAGKKFWWSSSSRGQGMVIVTLSGSSQHCCIHLHESAIACRQSW